MTKTDAKAVERLACDIERGCIYGPREVAANLRALLAERDALREALKKCERIMENRQPDKLPDGVHIARVALKNQKGK